MSWLHEFEAHVVLCWPPAPEDWVPPEAWITVVHQTCGAKLGEDFDMLDFQTAMDLAKGHVCEPVLREEDLTIAPVRAPGQPGHEGPRGVTVTHRPTGRIVTSFDGKSQLENSSRALKELKRQLREEAS